MSSLAMPIPSLDSFSWRWCGHRLALPHSLHWLLWRWCRQMLDPRSPCPSHLFYFVTVNTHTHTNTHAHNFSTMRASSAHTHTHTHTHSRATDAGRSHMNTHTPTHPHRTTARLSAPPKRSECARDLQVWFDIGRYFYGTLQIYT